MVDLLKFLLSQIVDQPDQITVQESSDPSGAVILSATVAPEDMGKVIGKGGKIISAVRELVKVKAVKSNQRVRVVLTEPAGTDPLSRSEPEAESADKS